MKFQNQQRAISALFLGILIVSFAGCKWWSKQSSSSSTASCGEALLIIDGKPVLTIAEYEEQLDMARKANQQIEMLLSMMPNAEKDIIFKSMAGAKITKAWVQKQGIDQSNEFKKQQHQLHEAMDLQLYMKYFDDAHPVSVSDADVEKFYEEKKDLIPALTVTPGGVDTSYVRFESKAAAEKFLTQVKEVKKAEAFKTMAEEQKQKVGQSVVNAKSPFGSAIKNVILETKKFPSVHMVKADDNAYWVLFTAKKSEAKYRDLKSPEVQQGLRKMLIDEIKGKQMEQLIDQLKTELNVIENSAYFEQKAAQKQQDLQGAQHVVGMDDQMPTEEFEQEEISVRV